MNAVYTPSARARICGLGIALFLPLWLAACGGGTGSDSGTSSSSTTPAMTPLVPTLSLSANPTAVASGGSTTLTWSSTDATSCSASGAWSGAKNTSGSQAFSSLTSNTTYTLSCAGSGGSASKSVTVTVGSNPAPTVSLAANPIFVSANGSSTLTWSSTNATSCTASGSWSGSKPTSGSQPVGPIATTSSYILGCTGAGGSDSRSVTITVGTPPSSSTFSMPTLEDERSTYRKWGWTWNSNIESNVITDPYYEYNSKSTYTVVSPDIHGDTEGDDLWTYLMMYQRTGNTVYYNRAKAWRDYFVNIERGSPEYQYDIAFLYDHMYGWGLVDWYLYTCKQGACDTAALTAAEAFAGDVESYWSTRVNNTWPVPGQFDMAFYSLRQGARHLLLASRLAEVTGKQRWMDLRGKLTEIWMQSPDWDSRGMYFFGDWQTDNAVGNLGPGSYAAGARVMSTFQIGILEEAFFNVWRTTGRTDVRDRMIAMAQFVKQYALEPTCQYAASYFGFVGGKPWYSYTCGGFWDPVYTTSLVNTLVLGYKLTGDTTFYDSAKQFFNRGTKGIYGSSTARETSDNVVGHFVDTKFASATGYFYLDYNKGELQYTYLIFENGGL